MIPERWQVLARAPPRAWGPAVASGQVRAVPEDFVVEEALGFAPAGAGAHVLLRVRKRDANTEWVARALAREARCRASDVGYAGLKDRRALATQWFSVPASRRAAEEWRGLSGEGFEVLDACAHTRKLPRGAHAGNRFSIRITGLTGDPAEVGARLDRIRTAGVPNYFGPQRFGRDLGNLAVLAGTAPGLPGARSRPSFTLSAARSLVFNAILAERVQTGTWGQLCAGDWAVLDGRGSIFAVMAGDAELGERSARLEVHPTGALWGRGLPPTTECVHALECRVAGELPEACQLVEAAGMAQERRSLRVAARDLSWHFGPQTLQLDFRLARGAFATSVLAELLDGDTVRAGEV